MRSPFNRASPSPLTFGRTGPGGGGNRKDEGIDLIVVPEMSTNEEEGE